MAIKHRKGYKSVEEAEQSKAFLRTPGATIETGCDCGQVHVNMMGSLIPALTRPYDAAANAGLGGDATGGGATKPIR